MGSVPYVCSYGTVLLCTFTKLYGTSTVPYCTVHRRPLFICLYEHHCTALVPYFTSNIILRARRTRSTVEVASPLSTDTSTWALLSLRLTWMQSRTQLGVVSIQQSPWRLGGAMRTCSWGGFSTLGRPMPSTKSRGSIASWSTWTRGPLVPGHVHT